MSYQKYQYSNTRYTVTLYQEGASANAPTRRLRLWGESPLIVERDTRGVMDSRWSTRCELHLVSDTHYAYEHIVLDKQHWRIEVSVDGEKIFSGRVERGLYEENYDSLPYEVVITATCGLKSLDDYRLDIDSLPRTSMQLTSLWEVIKGCLKLTGTSEVRASGDIASWLTTAHINREDYRTNENGLRSTQMAGEVLDGILSSLALICFHTGKRWMIESVSARSTSLPIVLETRDRYLEGTPTLQTEAPIGSLRINLPSEESDSTYTLAPVTLPMSSCAYSQDYMNIAPAPSLQLSAAPRMSQGAKLPTASERARGVVVRLPYIENEAIGATIPYHPPQGATGIKVEIELGFDGISEVEVEEEIQVVCEMKICDTHRPLFMASCGGVCYVGVDHVDPKTMHYYKKISVEERRDNYPVLYGAGKDNVATFKSVWSVIPRHKMQYDAYNKTTIDDYTRDHLTYSKVQKKDLRGDKLGCFSFYADLPYPQMVEIHEQRKKERGISYRADMQQLSVYIPMYFWSFRNQQSEAFQPKEILVGRISFRYEFADKEEYDTFLIADRGKSYLRAGEPIDLTYTTEIAGILLPSNLKGQLRTADNQKISTLGGRTNSEWIAASYFATMAEPHDTLTLTTNTKSPYQVGTLFQLRNRPKHTYRLMGSRYDVKQATSELTLGEAPKALETTTYDL